MMVRRLLALTAVFLVGCSGGAPTTPAATAPRTLEPAPTPVFTPTSTVTPATPATPTMSPTPPPSVGASATPFADADVIAAIDVGLGPCAMVELDGSVWVTDYSEDKLVRVDGATNAVVQSVEVGSSPCGVAVADGKLWVSVLGKNALVEVDPQSGTIENTIDLGGDGWDVQAGFDSVWVAVQGPDQVLRIDPRDGSVVARIQASGPLVSGLVVTPTQVWVANQGGTTIDRIDPGKNKLAASIGLPGNPFWFAAGDSSILVTLSNDDEIVLLDPTTGEASAPVEVGTRPRDPGFVNGTFWVANQASGDASVVDTSGSVRGTFSVPGAAGIFVAEGALGDGWILDYGGTTAFRMKATAGT